MSGKAKPHTPISANLSLQQMESSLPKIERRISDLEKFELEVDSIESRHDPKIDALEKELDALLVSVFGAGTVEYDRYHWGVTRLDTASVNMMHATPIQEVRSGLHRGIATAKANLESIKKGFLEEIEDNKKTMVVTGNTGHVVHTQSVLSNSESSNRNVFIVHGHDNGTKQDVARFLEKLKLNPVILHEKPNEGKTIIEKFEAHSDVGFAVILMTPDDVGGVKDNEIYPRARQNVILELGYFIGALGRNRVCALHTPGVELPSDLHGVLYVPLDKSESWKIQLAKEIKASGISIDMNLAV